MFGIADLLCRWGEGGVLTFMQPHTIDLNFWRIDELYVIADQIIKFISEKYFGRVAGWDL